MKINDLFQETFSALLVNKARSALTILGIVIGIGSVIALVSVGEGAKSSIEENIASLGSNLLTIMPGASRGAGAFVSAGRGSSQSLTLTDASSIYEQVKKVSLVSPEVSSRYQITAKGTNTNTQVLGVSGDYLAAHNISVASGAFITAQNIASNSKVAVLGPTTRDDLFGENANVIGQTIRINKIIFTVIGVTAAKGGSGFSNQDDMIFIPYTTAQRFLTGNDYFSSIAVQVASQDEMSVAEDEITALLLANHQITDSTLADFSIINQADIVESASSVTETFTMLLGAIAGISLVVGGIGIMNMMLTSVTERTREIGLRKAIGAKTSDINTQFLAEAIMLTIIGGGVGVFVGWLTSLAISHFASLNTSISLTSILLAFGVSAFIGISFGYYPARKASKLNPIEALRYE